ncbi:MAG TPA: glycosyltransferase family 2 protein [Dissulfurispiraceae bacterium]|nr:glycosyltransferase family 2 protein [Dissulfurispiraceae bacterium]
MATLPYFVVSPNSLMSIFGLLHGPDKTVPTPAENRRDAVVDVVIPVFNEQKNIAHCLASIAKQTLRPRNVILIDDGSSDRTLEYAKDMSETLGLGLIAIRREKSIGKTPTIKRQSREFDADVEFILDGDTVLGSPNYIERTVQELYQGIGIACACGVILPLRDKDRTNLDKDSVMHSFLQKHPEAKFVQRDSMWQRVKRGITNLYRDALYMFLQRFVYHGQMVFVGSITNPVGCAVAYRRKYVKDLFDKYEPILGDDLTNSEDIFIGFAMTNKGYRNIQVADVYARSEEPEATRLPRQIYMWSSSFLQSCYYFDDLLKTPFRVIASLRKKWRDKKVSRETEQKRKIVEQYRQSFGEEYTKKYGRPVGWILFTSLLEKIAFPTSFLVMLLLQLWEPLVITILAEVILCTLVLFVVAKGQRFNYALKGLVVTPLRYAYLMYDFTVILRFAADVWIFKDKKWRK